MSRPDFDDYDAPPPRPAGKSAPVALTAALAAGLVLALTACGGAALYWARAARVADERVQLVSDAEVQAIQSAAVAKAKAMARVYTRDEFRALVMGKTITEVNDLLGPGDDDAPDALEPPEAPKTPDAPKQDDETDTLTVFYRGRTIDSATGRPDQWVRVVFDFRVVRLVDTRVIRVEFEPTPGGPAPKR